MNANPRHDASRIENDADAGDQTKPSSPGRSVPGTAQVSAYSPDDEAGAIAVRGLSPCKDGSETANHTARASVIMSMTATSHDGKPAQAAEQFRLRHEKIGMMANTDGEQHASRNEEGGGGNTLPGLRGNHHHHLSASETPRLGNVALHSIGERLRTATPGPGSGLANPAGRSARGAGRA
jgi:hypothetical protein